MYKGVPTVKSEERMNIIITNGLTIVYNPHYVITLFPICGTFGGFCSKTLNLDFSLCCHTHFHSQLFNITGIWKYSQ